MVSCMSRHLTCLFSMRRWLKK